MSTEINDASTPATTPNEGVKRLAILLGCLGGLFAMIALLTNGEVRRTFFDWTCGALVITAFSLVPFGLVHAIAWVIRGFKQHPPQNTRQPNEHAP